MTLREWAETILRSPTMHPQVYYSVALFACERLLLCVDALETLTRPNVACRWVHGEDESEIDAKIRAALADMED
jgi:hypothetical protein